MAVAAIGVLLVLVILWDAFETIVLPRRVSRRIRLARLFYRATYIPWRAVARRMTGGQREATLAVYGPLALLLLLMAWAAGLILGFAGLYWALSPPGTMSVAQTLYFSGSTLFPLSHADVPLPTPLAHILEVVESGLGVGFLALVIGYLPVTYQAFSRREVRISLLDARAGSPPTAAEMLLRHRDMGGMEALRELLHEWELWSAEFLEIHLSYPVLAYFRSQHDNQSWLAALTTILDTTSLVIIGVEGACQRQAERTFAIARHAVVDLAIIFNAPPFEPEPDRLSAAGLAQLRSRLSESGLKLREGNDGDQKLAELRGMYEPYISSLAQYFHIAIPPWMHPASHPDNWQMSVWERPSRPFHKRKKGHF